MVRCTVGDLMRMGNVDQGTIPFYRWSNGLQSQWGLMTIRSRTYAKSIVEPTTQPLLMTLADSLPAEEENMASLATSQTPTSTNHSISPRFPIRYRMWPVVRTIQWFWLAMEKFTPWVQTHEVNSELGRLPEAPIYQYFYKSWIS